MHARQKVSDYWLLEQLLFNFGIANMYAFLSGIFLSLAANIITSIMFNNPSDPDWRFVAAALMFLLSSSSTFLLNGVLESARQEWIIGGASNARQFVLDNYIFKAPRWTVMWVCACGFAESAVVGGLVLAINEEWLLDWWIEALLFLRQA